MDGQNWTDRILILYHYTSKGGWVGEEVVNDEELIKKYQQLKDVLLEAGVPMNKFIKNINN